MNYNQISFTNQHEWQEYNKMHLAKKFKESKKFLKNTLIKQLQMQNNKNNNFLIITIMTMIFKVKNQAIQIHMPKHKIKK